MVILNNPKHITKGSSYNTLIPWLGYGLLTSTGDKWHKHRKIITPAFHFSILNIFAETMLDNAKIFVDVLSKKADGKPFNAYPFITNCTLDIICETAMGIQTHAQDAHKEHSTYVSAVYKMSDISSDRMKRPWLLLDFIFKWTSMGREQKETIKILHNFTTSVIKKKKAQPPVKFSDIEADENLGQKTKLAFLDILLQSTINDETLTDEEIREEVDTFMFEGHDTTTAGLSWTILMLGEHPEIQRKAQEEIDGIFDDNRRATKKDIAQMKYLEAVIKESLRLYPSVPAVSRTLGEDLKLNKYTIPRGTEVGMSFFTCQRSPIFYENPEKFDPERFFRNDIKHPFAYTPFSAGFRNCIGQKFALLEEKIILSAILRKFTIKTIDFHKVKLVTSLILRPGNGVNITLTPREK